MQIEKENVIGIVGGMGPEAGMNLFNCILAQTEAGTDQEHFSVMMASFPKHIVDRTAYLEGVTVINPAYNVAKIIEQMEVAGANIIGMACNTIHAPRIYDVITGQLKKINSRVKMLHMPYETCRFIKEIHPHIRRIGVLTTNGTYISGIYQDLLREWEYEPVIPAQTFQNEVIHRMIYDTIFGIKAKPGHITAEVRKLLEKALLYFKQEKADAIILGCTELSLILQEKSVNGMLIIDSTQALANALVREATNYTKMEPGKEKNSVQLSTTGIPQN